MTLIENHLISEDGLDLGFLHDFELGEDATIDWSSGIEADQLEDDDVAADRAARRAEAGLSRH